MKKTLSATRPQDRRAVLSQRRGLNMARSAHAYVRGNTLQFYEWLASATGKLLPQVPLSGFVATVTLEIWALWPTRMAE
jgi:uncharacterized protein (DUF2252 family)